MFTPWTAIDLFHNVRRTFTTLDITGDRTVTYRAKVKLHGENVAFQKLEDGAIECQSRTAILRPEKDGDPTGFARWAATVAAELGRHLLPGQVVFGEWCGPGVYDGTAVYKVPTKILAVFAMLDVRDPAHPVLVTDPGQLALVVPARAVLPAVHVLPWHADVDITVNWSASDAALTPVVEQINAWVAQVEACDPWVKATFGIDGPGEGLVFYPEGQPTTDAQYLRMFKAKGEKHRVVATKAAVQVSPEVAASLGAFAALVLPEARLEQGARAVQRSADGPAYDTKYIGPFVKWIGTDVAKETAAELAASGLDPQQAGKAVTDRARLWYLSKLSAQDKAG